MIFVLYLTSTGAYAGFASTSSFTFFANPSDLSRSSLMEQLRVSSSASIHVYLDSPHEVLEREDLSALTAADRVSYMHHQRAFRQTPRTWVSFFEMTPVHIVWVTVDHHPLSDWLSCFEALPSPIERISVVPLEISSPPSNGIIYYEDPGIGHRQIIHVGHLFYLTRLLALPSSTEDRTRELDHTKRYLHKRFQINSETIDIISLSSSLVDRIPQLASTKPVFNLAPVIQKKRSHATLRRAFWSIGTGLGLIGCLLLLYTAWLKHGYAQRATSLPSTPSPDVPIVSPSSMELIQSIVQMARTSPPFLPAYVEAKTNDIIPFFRIHSSTWHHHLSSETLILNVSYKKKNTQHGYKKLVALFPEGPCHTEITYEACGLYTITLTRALPCFSPYHV